MLLFLLQNHGTHWNSCSPISSRLILKPICTSGDVREVLATSPQAAKLFCLSKDVNLTGFLSGRPDLRMSSTQ